MTKGINNLRKFLIATMAIFFVIVALSAIVWQKDVAYASDDTKSMTVNQEKDLEYCGENYVNSEKVKQTFVDAFSFKIDGEMIEPDISKITIISENIAKKPGSSYYCDFVYLGENGTEYKAEKVNFKIVKKEVNVTVYLNGKTDLTVSESELKNVSIAYDYSGAAECDVEKTNVNGVIVNALKDSVLITPAFFPNMPNEPVENYSVTASFATSDYYKFNYLKSTITVTRQYVPEVKVEEDGKEIVAISGNYSSVYTLSFNKIGTSVASPEFVAVKTKVDDRYKNTGELLSNNEIIATYNLNMYGLKENVSISNVSGTVRILLDEDLLGKSEYQVIALYNNGQSDVLDAVVSSDGYVIFDVSDLGDFVLITPIQGVPTLTYIIAIVAGIAIVFIVIIMVALFRKKY